MNNKMLRANVLDMNHFCTICLEVGNTNSAIILNRTGQPSGGSLVLYSSRRRRLTSPIRGPDLPNESLASKFTRHFLQLAEFCDFGEESGISSSGRGIYEQKDVITPILLATLRPLPLPLRLAHLSQQLEPSPPAFSTIQQEIRSCSPRQFLCLLFS